MYEEQQRGRRVACRPHGELRAIERAHGAEVVGGQIPQGGLELVLGAPSQHGAPDGARSDRARRDAPRDQGRALPGHGADPSPVWRLGTRGPIRATISYAIVSARVASSQAVTVSAPWVPSTTTSSPVAGSASPQSTTT